jgi:hypothetical protein
MSLSSFLGAWCDRFRAWRSPTARATIERQEAYLAGQQVEDRRWETLPTPEGPVTARVATTGPAAETLAPLPDEALDEVRQAADMTMRFVHDHVRRVDASAWSLQDLDDAFANWMAHGDKGNCPPAAVERIVGAAFGEFCVRTLGIRWVLLTDEHGTDLAVVGAGDGEKYESVRTFPFAVVGKRIDAGETGFLVGVYRMLQARMT